MKAPDVSVLMTFLNSERYLAEAMESIVRQGGDYAWELLLVDDGSTDDSLRVAMNFAKAHAGKVRVLQHPGGSNEGISASRNLAMQHATADVLAFLDSDDVWLPNHLHTQMAVLNAHPNVAMVYAAAERWVDFGAEFDEAAARRATWGSNYLPPLIPAGERAGLLKRGELLRWFLQDQSLVPCICTVLVQTEVARSVAGFCKEFRGVYDDQVFHAKVSLQHDIFANDVPVARYRQHENSCCSRGRDEPSEVVRERAHFLEYLQMLGVSRPSQPDPTASR